MNLNCIIRSAGRSKNLVALVTAGELLAMLDDMNEFESTGEEYFQAICDIKGASKLNSINVRLMENQPLIRIQVDWHVIFFESWHYTLVGTVFRYRN